MPGTKMAQTVAQGKSRGSGAREMLGGLSRDPSSVLVELVLPPKPLSFGHQYLMQPLLEPRESTGQAVGQVGVAQLSKS